MQKVEMKRLNEIVIMKMRWGRWRLYWDWLRCKIFLSIRCRNKLLWCFEYQCSISKTLRHNPSCKYFWCNGPTDETLRNFTFGMLGFGSEANFAEERSLLHINFPAWNNQMEIDFIYDIPVFKNHSSQIFFQIGFKKWTIC